MLNHITLCWVLRDSLWNPNAQIERIIQEFIKYKNCSKRLDSNRIQIITLYDFIRCKPCVLTFLTNYMLTKTKWRISSLTYNPEYISVASSKTKNPFAIFITHVSSNKSCFAKLTFLPFFPLVPTSTPSPPAHILHTKRLLSAAADSHLFLFSFVGYLMAVEKDLSHIIRLRVENKNQRTIKKWKRSWVISIKQK